MSGRSSPFTAKPLDAEIEKLVRKHFPAGSNGKRGKATISLNVLGHCYEIAKSCSPITTRGVAYRLLGRKIIESMDAVNNVGNLVVEAREEGLIPWHWIVDETRSLEKSLRFKSKQRAYEKMVGAFQWDLWQDQGFEVQLWTEKGTVRGLLQELIDEFRLGLQVMHGYSSATVVHDVATQKGIPLVALYIGDHDPSGVNMRDHDLPARLKRYAEDDCREVDYRVIGLTKDQIEEHELPHIWQENGDTRRHAYIKKHGKQSWELDALEPDTLRQIVRDAVEDLIDFDVWEELLAREKKARRGFEGAVRRWADVPDPLIEQIADVVRWS